MKTTFHTAMKIIDTVSPLAYSSCNCRGDGPSDEKINKEWTQNTRTIALMIVKSKIDTANNVLKLTKAQTNPKAKDYIAYWKKVKKEIKAAVI